MVTKNSRVLNFFMLVLLILISTKDAAPIEERNSKGLSEENIGLHSLEDFASSSTDESDEDDEVFDEKPTQQVIDLGKLLKQKKNVIGGKLKCDENGCRNAWSSEEDGRDSNESL
ncbi:CLUMA_CG006220, isoform A [Clunio marinus]|uniref:CLUMA_CG006220, isoform A n=1 Tax=Clunio marinus TaxID=568069 RepID=A0A1J1HXZ2_9DIPT|nr:CLUMA_CG006220, isoform A [Clunio marinus]